MIDCTTARLKRLAIVITSAAISGHRPAVCGERSNEIREAFMAEFAPIGSLGWVLEALVPIALGWIVVYLIIGLWRWARAGFTA
jgi:hypothetical protein